MLLSASKQRFRVVMTHLHTNNEILIAGRSVLAQLSTFNSNSAIEVPDEPRFSRALFTFCKPGALSSRFMNMDSAARRRFLKLPFYDRHRSLPRILRPE